MALDILILRDPREARGKCTLTPLVGVPGVRFVAYRPERRLHVEERILLDPEGEDLTERDRGKDLLLVDCIWRKVPTLVRTVEGRLLRRRLPPLVSAYPRRSKTTADPEGGLASVEALFAATVLLGEPRPELLERYRWRKEFLERNPGLAPGGALP